MLDRLVIGQIIHTPNRRATNLIEKSSSKSQKTLRVGSKNSSCAKRLIVRNSYIAVEGIVLIIIDGIYSTYNKRVYYIKLINTLVWKISVICMFLISLVHTNIHSIDNSSSNKSTKILSSPIWYHLRIE